jgi:hypothetical protein
MPRVTGLGGLFFKSKDPAKLYNWYKKQLGLKPQPGNAGVFFSWREVENPKRKGMTVWSIFPTNTTYFRPSRAPFMMNFRVDDLDGLLKKLKKRGVMIDAHREDYEYGRFAWIMDPDGNRIELWEPPK